MALDEPKDSLDRLDSNGITAYIDPKLNEYLAQVGDIRVNYITNETGSGYSIRVGELKCGQEQGGCSCMGESDQSK